MDILIHALIGYAVGLPQQPVRYHPHTSRKTADHGHHSESPLLSAISVLSILVSFTHREPAQRVYHLSPSSYTIEYISFPSRCQYIYLIKLIFDHMLRVFIGISQNPDKHYSFLAGRILRPILP